MARYWVGDGGSWEDTAHWSTGSGGAGGASVPNWLIGPQDIIFDDKSFTLDGQTVTVDTRYGNDFSGGLSLDMSTVTHSPALAINDTAGTNNSGLWIVGNITIPADVVVTGTDTVGGIRRTGFITTGTSNVSIASPFTANQSALMIYSGTLTLTNDLDVGYFEYYQSGGSDAVTIDFNDYNVSVNTFSAQVLVYAGSGTITVTKSFSAGYSRSVGFTGGEFFCETSNFVIDAVTSTTNTSLTLSNEPGTPTQSLYNLRVVDSGDATHYFLLQIDPVSTEKTYTVNVNNLTIDPSTYMKFQGRATSGSGQIMTVDVAGTFSASGTLGNGITLARGNTSTSKYIILADTTNIDYVTVSYCTAGGGASPFDDTNGGVDGGNNVNWLFPTDPSASPSISPSRSPSSSASPSVSPSASVSPSVSPSVNSQFFLVKTSGRVCSDYLNISNSNAYGGAQWFAGKHALDTLNNDGWIFDCCHRWLDKYSSKGTSWGDKFSSKNTAWTDKYSSKSGTWTDKYSSKGTTYTDKYSNKSTTWTKKYDPNDQCEQ